MCDFSAVRTRLWILLGLLIVTVMAAILGLVFLQMPGWSAIARAISLWFAVAWVAALLLALFASVIPAIDTYCKCTKPISACQSACTFIRFALTFVIAGAGLVALGAGLSAAGATSHRLPSAKLELAIGAGCFFMLVGLGLGLAWVGTLASCQSTVPRPAGSRTGTL